MLKSFKSHSTQFLKSKKLFLFFPTGEVIVQRLNLQVLWVQPPPFENAKVCGIGWRPDERILAIGKINIENK